jgi:hypothetical protein
MPEIICVHIHTTLKVHTVCNKTIQIEWFSGMREPYLIYTWAQYNTVSTS